MLSQAGMGPERMLSGEKDAVRKALAQRRSLAARNSSSSALSFSLPTSLDNHSLMEVVVNQKIYVGNLPYSTTDQELQDLLAAHGTVQSANVVTDPYTGRSRGFGFIEMGSAEDAQQAITALHDSDFQGRNLVVNEARPKERNRPPGGY